MASIITQPWSATSSIGMGAPVTTAPSMRPARIWSSALMAARLPLAQAPPISKLGPLRPSSSAVTVTTSVSSTIMPKSGSMNSGSSTKVRAFSTRYGVLRLWPAQTWPQRSGSMPPSVRPASTQACRAVTAVMRPASGVARRSFFDAATSRAG
jgi:hypothetical protein